MDSDKVDINDVIETYSKLLKHLEGHIKEGDFEHLDIIQSAMLKRKIKALKKILDSSKK
jgi:hypothetical protein